MVLLVSVPSLIFFVIGSVPLMVNYFRIAFSLTFIYFAFFRSGIVLAGFTLTQFPFINFLKGDFYFYFITTALLLIVYFILFLKNNSSIRQLFNNSRYLFFFIFFALYFLFGFMLTGKYFTTMKSIDLILAAGLIPMLYKHNMFFKNAVFLLGINAVFFAIIVGLNGSRFIGLGSSFYGGAIIGGGNPISYGIPVALMLTMLFFSPSSVIPDKILYRNKNLIWILVSITIIALIVTTSRGSILAFLLCLMTVMFIKRSIISSSKYLVIIAFSILAYYVASMLIPEFNMAQEFIVGRAQDKSMDANRYSHNRLIMWQMVGESLRNGKYIFLGVGPGNQMDEFSKIVLTTGTMSVFRSDYAFHALPLQFVIEIGLIITLIFYFAYFYYFASAVWLFNKSGLILPLLGFVFWFGITLSTSGVDMLSGLALGFAFIKPQSKIDNNQLNT